MTPADQLRYGLNNTNISQGFILTKTNKDTYKDSDTKNQNPRTIR